MIFVTKGFVNMRFWKCVKQKGLTAVNMYKKFWDFVNGNFNINSAYLFDFFFIWVFSFTTTHNFWKIIHFVYCVLEFGYFPIFMCSVYFSKKAGKAQAKLIILRLRATLHQHIASHTGAKTNFYPEITKNLMFAKCEFCEEWGLEKCEFCQNWNFENVNFVKNEISKMWILSKLRLWKWDF